MAFTVLSDLIAEVVFRVSPDKTSDAAYDARVLKRINWAIRDIAELKEPAEFEVLNESTTLVDGSAAYTKPDSTTTGNILALKTLTILGSSAGVRPIVLRPLLRRQYDSSDIYTTSVPAWFFDVGAQIRLVPTPGVQVDSRRLRYQYIKEPAVVTDADEDCPLTTRWDEAIVCGAAMKYLRDDGQHERARAAAQDYMAALGIRRQKKAIQFAASGGRSLGLGR